MTLMWWLWHCVKYICPTTLSQVHLKTAISMTFKHHFQECGLSLPQRCFFTSCRLQATSWLPLQTACASAGCTYITYMVYVFVIMRSGSSFCFFLLSAGLFLVLSYEFYTCTAYPGMFPSSTAPTNISPFHFKSSLHSCCGFVKTYKTMLNNVLIFNLIFW